MISTRGEDLVQLDRVWRSHLALKSSEYPKNIHFFRFLRALSQNLGMLASNGLQIRVQHVKKHRNT